MFGAHEGMGWWMVFGSVMFVIFWGVVIWAIANLAGAGSPQVSKRGSNDGSALDIARQRYARGEISKDEFEQLKRDLS